MQLLELLRQTHANLGFLGAGLVEITFYYIQELVPHPWLQVKKVLEHGKKWEYTGVTGSQRDASSAERLELCPRPFRERKEKVCHIFME